MSSRYFRRTFDSSSGRSFWDTGGRLSALELPGRLSAPKSSVPANNERAARADDERRVAVPGAGSVFGRDGADRFHQPLDLALHLLESRTEVENDLHARQVHAEVAGQRQDDLEPLDRLVVVEPGVSRRARRPDEALALVEAERLRVDAEAARDDSNQDVRRLARAFGVGRAPAGRPGPAGRAPHGGLLLLLDDFCVDDIVALR